ncbi:MAG: hypothetical protein HY700_17125, partial [Gemmatimonadetes bacterium]|nr:hypothetical protein [Gemmatimonadota bacterium]
ALLGLYVQKYGRTTRLTHGQITGINATVNVCYAVSGSTCTKLARYVDQLIITPGTFSGGGDSGSLIVTDGGNLNPVALLFAGSTTMTIANRIDLVLNRFGVSIDGLAPPPPGPLTDVAVTNVGAPGSVVLGGSANVTVTVKNFGNQDVSGFDVTLRDTTENVTIGSQSVPALAAGATSVLTFSWTPASTGDHYLIGSHTLADDRPANNQSSATVAVNPPLTDVAVTGVTAPVSVSQGKIINVAVTVGNVGNQDVGSSFTVTLQDATDNVTLGTQTVTGLNVGANTTLTFPWNTTSATLGGHTLVATHSFTDDNAANNQRSVNVTVNPKTTDIALTAITGPASVTQGATADIGVTVQNVGDQDVTASFDVVLTDATAGVTIGTQTVTGLAMGATATLTIPWNTTGVATGGHTLIARQMLVDDNGTNNSRAIGITVTAPVSPPTDIAVTGITAPASITQGATTSIGVTIQNVGQQNVGASFDVVLTDSTTGTTLGTQTVAGLATGSTATLTFSWNTTGVPLGNHTLVATHSFTDDNAANNRRSTTVSVNPKLTDIALTSFTGPSSVTQGTTANYGVTVQNVGEQDVGTSFDVVLTDATAGVTIGTQTVAGLAIGASASLTFAWNTTGVATGGHTLIARQLLADGDGTNNSRAIGITVNAPPSLVTDIAVTGMTAPASVGQGKMASIAVTVGNVGNQHVTGSFEVTLQDATDNITIGTQTVAGLNAGAGATLSFSWNTATSSVGGHTLVATHDLTDDNAANNQRSVAVTVNPKMTDIAVTSLSGPASVTQGNTANMTVIVQNVGEQDVGTSFDVVLTDAAAGVAIGTQVVPGLSIGASATLSFAWNTTGSSLGGHTLVAAHSVPDDNAGNNQRSVSVTVNPKLTDIALTSLTGPASVTQGNTANFGVTVQNVGEQDVTTSFDVVLTDATIGVTIGTQTVAGLALGASSALSFSWSTAGAATGGHTLIARQMLADGNSTNNSRAIGITVNPPSVHVADLDGFTSSSANAWSAIVEVTVHDANHNPVNGATVRGSWSLSGSSTNECTTGALGGNGTCSVLFSSIPKSTKSLAFAVSGVIHSADTYQPSANHDQDGSSNGTTIFVNWQ